MNKKNLDKSILFIDSGIGGLTTLAEASKLSPLNYIYFADNKFAPYGTKSTHFLKQRLFDIVCSMSKKYKLSMVVLACNTATTNTISFLRNCFPELLFIGTEPAFKVASDKNFKSPALVATKQTVKQLNKIKLKNFSLIPHKSLASQIEDAIISNTPQSQFNLLKSIYLLKRQTKNNDCLILGCTHYIFIKEKLSSLLKLPIFDGNTGVSKQIFRNNLQNQASKSSFKIILSHKNRILSQKYKKILKQILANQINLC